MRVLRRMWWEWAFNCLTSQMRRIARAWTAVGGGHGALPQLCPVYRVPGAVVQLVSDYSRRYNHSLSVTAGWHAGLINRRAGPSPCWLLMCQLLHKLHWPSYCSVMSVDHAVGLPPTAYRINWFQLLCLALLLLIPTNRLWRSRWQWCLILQVRVLYCFYWATVGLCRLLRLSAFSVYMHNVFSVRSLCT